MSHLGFCHIRDYVAIRIMSFGIMSHSVLRCSGLIRSRLCHSGLCRSGLCRLVYCRCIYTVNSINPAKNSSPMYVDYLSYSRRNGSTVSLMLNCLLTWHIPVRSFPSESRILGDSPKNPLIVIHKIGPWVNSFYWLYKSRSGAAKNR